MFNSPILWGYLLSSFQRLATINFSMNFSNSIQACLSKSKKANIKILLWLWMNVITWPSQRTPVLFGVFVSSMPSVLNHFVSHKKRFKISHWIPQQKLSELSMVALMHTIEGIWSFMIEIMIRYYLSNPSNFWCRSIIWIKKVGIVPYFLMPVSYWLNFFNWYK